MQLWAPGGDADRENDIRAAVEANQRRLQEGPRTRRGLESAVMATLMGNPRLLQALARHVGTRGEEGGGGGTEEEEEEEEEGDAGRQVRCRVS
jgi:hypothetical protein